MHVRWGCQLIRIIGRENCQKEIHYALTREMPPPGFAAGTNPTLVITLAVRVGLEVCSI